MSRIWVANTTMQEAVFCYRLDFVDFGATRKMPFRQVPIPSGGQHPIEVNVGNIDELVQQLSKLGAIEAKELPRVRHVVPYVYSVDKQVSPHIIRDVHAHNTGLKIVDGGVRRERAAIGAAQAVMMKTGTEIPEITVEMEQLDQSENGESRIEAGYVVTKNAQRGAPPPATKGRGGRRKAA